MSAAPRIEFLGTDDQSIKIVPAQAVETGTHVPLFVIQSEKGTTEKKLFTGEALNAVYGDTTFDPTSKYFTPNTKYLMDLYGLGSAVVVKRHVDPSVNKVSNVTIYLDVLPTTVDVYKRHVDGSIAYDDSGNPIIEEQGVEGYKIKLIAEVNDDTIDSPLGAKTIKTGTMTDAAGNTSSMYPILELRGKYLGEFYNNVGFTVNLLTRDDADEDFIQKTRNLEYEFSIYHKDDEGNPIVFKSLFNSVSVKFVFQPNTKDPYTNADIDLSNILSYWYNTTDVNLPQRDYELENIYFYKDNYEALAKNLVSKELPYVGKDVTTVEGDIVNTSEWTDLVSDLSVDLQAYLINPFNCFSSKGVPYFTVQYSNDIVTLPDNQQEVTFSNMTPIFLGNGEDGEVSWTELQNGLSTLLDEYVDPASKVQDILINPESVLYDTGFDLEIKKKMVNFITLRKDTIIMLGTHEYRNADKPNDLITDRAVAIALRSSVNLAPESTFYGTPVTRAIIVMGAGRIIRSTSNDYYSLTYDLAIKNAKFMSGQQWKMGNLFDRGELNVINTMKDIYPDFIPVPTRKDIWNIGAVYPQPYDVRQYMFAGLQTVYESDSSVLNSYFVAFALTYINKVAAEIWRDLTGSVSMTPAEIIQESENRANAKLKNAFGTLIKVIPQAYMTKDDQNAGYIWRLKFKIGANIPKTVMYTHTVAYRMEDLQ